MITASYLRGSRRLQRAAPADGLGAEVLRRVGQQRHVAGPLEGDRQLALVRGAGAGLAARLDLGALGEVAAEAVDLLVVDRDRLVGAEGADLPAPAIAVVVVALLGVRGGIGVSRCRRPAVGAAVRSGRSSEGEVVEVVVSSVRPDAGAAGRAPAPPGGAANGALLVADAGVEADDVVGGDLEGGPLLAVLGLVLAGPEAALDEDLVALAELLGRPLGAVAPDDDAEPVGLLGPLAGLLVRGAAG